MLAAIEESSHGSSLGPEFPFVRRWLSTVACHARRLNLKDHRSNWSEPRSSWKAIYKSTCPSQRDVMSLLKGLSLCHVSSLYGIHFWAGRETKPYLKETKNQNMLSTAPLLVRFGDSGWIIDALLSVRPVRLLAVQDEREKLEALEA